MGVMSYFKSPDAIKAFFEREGQKVVYDKNQTFVRPDDPRPWVYVLQEGLVAASFNFENGTKCILGYFIPNTVFAQNRSFYENDGGGLEYTTVTKAVIYRLHRDTFLKQVENDPAFNREYLHNVSQFRIFTTDRAICLAENRIHNRCIRWLMLMANYYSEPVGKGSRIIIPFTQGTIAEFLSVSRESVSKVIHSLVQDGHISIHRKQITITNVARLRDLLEA
ncbi:Crp/Fnr family transcriptional regulator [Candidatus Saccharibacteria bacterium]|nr:MAG: Crp/Fnr family transcriptional regulator [Candidatus Saccharibacteria bacterium]